MTGQTIWNINAWIQTTVSSCKSRLSKPKTTAQPPAKPVTKVAAHSASRKSVQSKPDLQPVATIQKSAKPQVKPQPITTKPVATMYPSPIHHPKSNSQNPSTLPPIHPSTPSPTTPSRYDEKATVVRAMGDIQQLHPNNHAENGLPSSETLSNGQNDIFKASIYRILDANLDRAREGLRIIEEWCRFSLNDVELTRRCKDWRQQLAQWHTPEIRAARDTPEDPGTELTHAREAQRSNIQDVLQANFCRTEEALRVLEEYGKVHHPEMAAACKQLRYQVYTLESDLIGQQRHRKLLQARCYLVTSPSDRILEIVEAALKGGLHIVQYREKQQDDCDRIPLAQKLCDLCHRYGALFIVNDRVDIALAVNADGVHLGQQDMPIATARQLLGTNRIIGRSTTNPDEMSRAIAEGADYIGVGPVYATPTKPNKAAAGLDYVRHAAAHATVPWFAIGGIDADNLGQVIEAGCDRVAVVRAIMAADQPTLMTQFFVTQLANTKAYKISE